MHHLLHEAICPVRGRVRWAYPDEQHDNFDAVFFICFLGLPLIPTRAAHVFRYRPSGSFERTYEWIPIRWTFSTVMLACARRLALVLPVWALPLGLFAVGAIYSKDDPDGYTLLMLCVLALVVSPFVWGLCWFFDRETRAMRRIMGDWYWGSCDPMTLTEKWIAGSEFANVETTPFRAKSWAQAVENCYRIRNWWGGLFAARMIQRFEDPVKGRDFVERIMTDPEVQEALQIVGNSHERWRQLLGPGRYGGT